MTKAGVWGVRVTGEQSGLMQPLCFLGDPLPHSCRTATEFRTCDTMRALEEEQLAKSLCCDSDQGGYTICNVYKHNLQDRHPATRHLGHLI